jgi:hypothetical protein
MVEIESLDQVIIKSDDDFWLSLCAEEYRDRLRARGVKLRVPRHVRGEFIRGNIPWSLIKKLETVQRDPVWYVYLQIWRISGMQKRREEVTFSVPSLQKNLELSRSAVYRALVKLRNAGLIKWRGRKLRLLGYETRF